MVKIDILLRTNRRTISISISQNAEVVVKAPRSCSMTQIQNIVDNREHWINTHRQKILNNQQLNQNIFNYSDIMFCGQIYHVIFDDKIKHIELQSEYCIVPNKYRDNLIPALNKWYKKIGISILWGRVKYFANLMNVEPSKFRLNNARRCWGSCNNNGVITLNWRLIMLPHDLIDYVVVHELAHLLQLNHSKLFWDIVRSVLPDFATRRNLVKKGGYLLELYRI